VDIAKAHVFHSTSHSIEASRQSDEVKLPQLTVGCHNARLGDLFDRIGFDINDVVLRPVHCLVVVLLERWTLGSPRVGSLERSHQITLDRVTDPRPRLLHPELVGFVVGLSVEEVVFVSAEPEFEAALEVVSHVVVRDFQ
jgi:hypothetical protein